jgi:integrase/recombinase XerD
MDAYLLDGAPVPAPDVAKRALNVQQMFGDHLTLIVTLALNYGLRRQEVLQLRWDSVKPTSDNRWQLFITPESDKAGRGRYIPLNDSDWAIIRAWHRYQTGTKGIQSPWMFPHGPKLEPMTEIKSSWRGLIKRAAKRQPSLAGTTFRVLRATFGSKLVQKGVPILEVSRLLGHSSVTITEQHYAALSNQSAREAISMLDVLNDTGLEISEAVHSPRRALPQREK